MKFRSWDDFVEEINEYGRHGYVKKKSTYNPFTKVNTMLMQHVNLQDEVEFILYPDDESYDLDWNSDPYVKRQSRNDERATRQFKSKVDHRTKEHRSDKYPEKPGTKKSDDISKQSPPKPGPYIKKEKQE